MKSGFIFTFDAVLALLIVMLLAGAIAVQYSALPGKENVSDALRQKAQDRAITGFYLNSGGDSPDFSSAEFGECAAAHDLLENPKANSIGSQESVSEKFFCESA
ncbi:MAG: hypothetical protein JW744_03470 [Candidatus Diapherotrites archaeon]|uniref:Uncharacterized protein n=1 Tax=Candidatus Iainarchaeum sp. TaxID=3101447 RepID=A0A939C8Z2_9ARCH|nr:hypothetical protein [Candidatus Diapherotrites archaeon]